MRCCCYGWSNNSLLLLLHVVLASQIAGCFSHGICILTISATWSQATAMVNASSRCGCCGQCNSLCCCFSIVDHKGCNIFFWWVVVSTSLTTNCVTTSSVWVSTSLTMDCVKSSSVWASLTTDCVIASSVWVFVSATGLNANLQFELFQHLYING